jgi:hypothetical protein
MFDEHTLLENALDEYMLLMEDTCPDAEINTLMSHVPGEIISRPHFEITPVPDEMPIRTLEPPSLKNHKPMQTSL